LFQEENERLMGRPRSTHCNRGHERTPENLDKYRGCKPCANIKANEWKKRNRDKAQAMQIRWKYGVTAKPDVCDVCGLPNANGKKVSVDHDHKTGKVRGFLCHGCNIAIGMVKDDPDRLRRLADYLESK
jgi:hypothetical protein